jgi:cold-inducible RNA-binding protein
LSATSAPLLYPFRPVSLKENALMTTELYIGNLSPNTTEDEIRALFEPSGELTEVIIMVDEETGRSKGFGFVQMKNFIAAKEAIAGLNGQSLDKRELIVKLAGEHREPMLQGVSGGSLRNHRQGGRGRI